MAAKSSVQRQWRRVVVVHSSQFTVEQVTCVSMCIGVDAGVPTAGR